MLKGTRALAVVCALIYTGLSVAQCQTAVEQVVKIVAIDGRNGQPVPNQSILVFVETAEDNHHRNVNVTTDKDGVAMMMASPPGIRLGIFPEWEHLCYDDPNTRYFSLTEIAAKGISTPNGCGSHAAVLTPGRLTVFMRPEHWWESMAH